MGRHPREMSNAARIFRTVGTFALIGAVGGVVATAGQVGLAMRHAARGTVSTWMIIIDGGTQKNFITTFAVDPWATGVSVMLFPAGSGAGRGISSIEDLSPELLESSLANAMTTMPQPDDQRAPWRWNQGLSRPIESAGSQWRETVYGWPLRCLRVRGRTLNDGPLDLGEIKRTWGGTPGWSLAPVETLLSVGLFGVPIALGAVLFAAARGPLRRRSRRRAGRCEACGYDLAGRVAEGCPECGWGREQVRL